MCIHSHGIRGPLRIPVLSTIHVTTASTAAAPKTVEAARAVATEEAAAASSGDWAGAWGLWSAAGKKAISRADYVRLHTECKTITGVPLTVDNVRLEGDTAAVVRISWMGFAFSYTEVYESGQWRWQSNPDDTADYALGVKALIVKKKAAGSCM